MNLIRLFTWMYAQLLKLYPDAYRDEYGAELQAVFRLALQAEAQQGQWAVIRRGVRELQDAPLAAWQAHRRVRPAGQTANGWEIGAALAPFLLLGVLLPLLSPLGVGLRLPIGVFNEVAVAILGLLGILLLVGVGRGLPRWSLPYLGVILSLLSVYGCSQWFFDWLTSQLVTRQHPLFWRQLVHQGQIWLGLPLLTLVIVGVSWLLPPLRPFYNRLRQDWTLLSFMLYGAGLFALFVTFDDYPDEDPYLLPAMAFLAGGGWLYLRAAEPKRRLAMLVSGLTLAMLTAAIGKAIIYTSPDWPYPQTYSSFTWQTEAMSTMIMWGWLVLALLLPAGLNRLLRNIPALQAGNEL